MKTGNGSHSGKEIKISAQSIAQDSNNCFPVEEYRAWAY
jgi:hypothetical protein